MRPAIKVLLAAASLLVPSLAHAQSADIDGTIADVDIAALTITLDDGNSYQAPGEFNFEGLEEGVDVTIFYTNVDGTRVIDDLIVIE